MIVVLIKSSFEAPGHWWSSYGLSSGVTLVTKSNAIKVKSNSDRRFSFTYLNRKMSAVPCHSVWRGLSCLSKLLIALLKSPNPREIMRLIVTKTNPFINLSSRNEASPQLMFLLNKISGRTSGMNLWNSCQFGQWCTLFLSATYSK